MCHFGIVLTSYPDQLKITRMPVGRVQTQFHHSMSMSGLSWCHLVVHLMHIQGSAYSHTESLHWTLHASEGPNDSFEEEKCREGNEVEQPELMSQHEDDVGLMKDTTPLIINPKYDFLLQAGVIIPCDDSPSAPPFFWYRPFAMPDCTAHEAILSLQVYSTALWEAICKIYISQVARCCCKDDDDHCVA